MVPAISLVRVSVLSLEIAIIHRPSEMSLDSVKLTTFSSDSKMRRIVVVSVAVTVV